jgi:hypothetical protein
MRKLETRQRCRYKRRGKNCIEKKSGNVSERGERSGLVGKRQG